MHVARERRAGAVYAGALMMASFRRALAFAFPGFLLTAAAVAQGAQTRDSARGVPRFVVQGSGLATASAAVPWNFLAVPGRRAAVYGTATGTLELWSWPYRAARDIELAFRSGSEPAAIPAREYARRIVARPEGTTIVYSHATFIVRQHILTALQENGALFLLEVEALQPLEISLQLRTDASASPGFATDSLSWQGEERRFHITRRGLGSLHTLIGSPFAHNGQVAVSAEAPAGLGRLVLAFEPAVAATQFLPISLAAGTTPESADTLYRRLLARAPALWRERSEHYRRLQQELLDINTPDSEFNQAISWAAVNLDQRRACTPTLGCGIAAGLQRAGAGNIQPGLGWLYGADVGNAVAALTALGHHELAREGLRALGRFQRDNGAIARDSVPLPLTQTDSPADERTTTPYWISAFHEYWSATGDDAFLREQWPGLVKAYRWCAALDVSGSLQLAGAWLIALEGVEAMARALGAGAIAAEAATLFQKTHETVERTFWRESAGAYAASAAAALTVWPAVALSSGLLENARARSTLQELGSSALTTDWGVRTLSRYDASYDPLQFERGAVTPLLTGAAAALAHYRYHRGWAGHDLLRTLGKLTLSNGPGRVPDVFSGAFNDAWPEQAPHQTQGAAALVSPLVKGLLGVQVDGNNRALALETHLPAEWTGLSANGLLVGRERVNVEISRSNGRYLIGLRRAAAGAPIHVRIAPALPLGARVQRVRVNDADAPVQVEETAHDVHAVVELTLAGEAEVEIEYAGGLEVSAPPRNTATGEVATSLNVLDFRREGSEYIALVEGLPGATYTLHLRAESRVRSAMGAEIVEQSNDRLALRIRMPAGTTAFVRREIRITT